MKKRPSLRAAFAELYVDKVAKINCDNLGRLLNNKVIIWNVSKIDAIMKI
ncbi:MAG: hypothetical protein CBB68_04975 [Rhodospirillaceae bacterium TMED8]|nr:hypothetical protein [Magnetovibrio sp.]OUT51681.1 MAG: hypothetical protein CBB68_04975 [Rhodospirillaceae bacterium TMED8]